MLIVDRVASETTNPLGYSAVSSSARTLNPLRVLVLAIRLTMTS